MQKTYARKSETRNRRPGEPAGSLWMILALLAAMTLAAAPIGAQSQGKRAPAPAQRPFPEPAQPRAERAPLAEQPFQQQLEELLRWHEELMRAWKERARALPGPPDEMDALVPPLPPVFGLAPHALLEPPFPPAVEFPMPVELPMPMEFPVPAEFPVWAEFALAPPVAVESPFALAPELSELWQKPPAPARAVDEKRGPIRIEPKPGGMEPRPGTMYEKRGRMEQDRLYQGGTRALDERQWDRAIELFSQVAQRGERRADGALYWKAYAQNKQGRRDEALATLAELRKSHASSRWLDDAKALEVEIRQSSGRPVSPEGETDEDLKLMAINSLMNSDPERAVPLLEKLLTSGQSPRLKERALFVMAQSRSPRSREALAQVARGKGNPDMQMKAVQYLGMFGSKESRQLLADIYAGTSDVDVKRQILNTFMMAGERDRVLTAARSETVPELRRDAIRYVGMMRGRDEAERKQVGEALAAIYAGDKDPVIRKEVTNAMFMQGNAAALVEIARKETDLAMKKEIVQKLSMMKSKEATDYMLELLNK